MVQVALKKVKVIVLLKKKDLQYIVLQEKILSVLIEVELVQVVQTFVK